MSVSFNSISRLAASQYKSAKCDIVDKGAVDKAVVNAVELAQYRTANKARGVGQNASILDQTGAFIIRKASVKKTKKGAKSAPKALPVNKMAVKLIKSYSKAELRELRDLIKELGL